MFLLLSLISAVAPMLFYLLLLWWFDKYDREPLRLVFLNFLWGAFGAIILAIIASSILSMGFHYFIRNPKAVKFAETVIIAPFIEEIMKGIFLLFTIYNKKFDNLTDGLVYGGAIGLGFGMTENFLYFISFADSLQTLIFLVTVRSLFSAVMHCLSTASLGAFLSLARFSHSDLKFFYPLIGLFTAMLMHFIWNLTISFQLTAAGGFFFIAVSVLLFIIVYSSSIKTEKRIIIDELTDDINNNLIPAWSVNLFERNYHADDENIKRNYKKFRKALAALAFRKSQLKMGGVHNHSYYQQEIENHRLHIQNLYHNS